MHIIPTPINMLTAANDHLVQLRHAGRELTLKLPDLRQRAWLLVKQTGIVPLDGTPPEPTR